MTWAYLENEKLPSITNIGFNPTFNSVDPYLKVETHIFNFSREIYGEHLKVELIEFHRDEMKFASVEQLKQQIFADLNVAKNYFGLS